MSLSQAQIEKLQAFEHGLDPRQPERSKIPAQVLGYGEISTVFAIDAEGLNDLAFKRMSLFHNLEEVEAYRAAHEEYNRLLQAEIGLRLPPHSLVSFPNQAGRPIVYIIQRQLPPASIGNQALHLLPREGVRVLVRRILQELRRLWEFNRSQAEGRGDVGQPPHLQVGIDGQISNWSIDRFDPQHPHVDQETTLTYMDTSTPFLRVDGVEQLDFELLARPAPSFLVWILRLLFLEDTVNRYYDFRQVAIDLAANLYKEQRPELVPDVVAEINDLFAGKAENARRGAVPAPSSDEPKHAGRIPALGGPEYPSGEPKYPLGEIQPIEEKEVRSYYREDALLWRLYLSMRRLDRTLRTRILRREYPYILPGKIKR